MQNFHVSVMLSCLWHANGVTAYDVSELILKCLITSNYTKTIASDIGGYFDNIIC